MAAGEWFLHRDNAPVHTVQNIRDFLTKNEVRTISHPPYNPDLVPADFWLFPTLKNNLAGHFLTQEGVQKEVEYTLKNKDYQHKRVCHGVPEVETSPGKMYPCQGYEG